MKGCSKIAIPASPNLLLLKSSSLKCELFSNDSAIETAALASTILLLKFNVFKGVFRDKTYAISWISLTPIMLSGRLKCNILNNSHDFKAHLTNSGPRSDS